MSRFAPRGLLLFAYGEVYSLTAWPVKRMEYARRVGCYSLHRLRFDGKRIYDHRMTHAIHLIVTLTLSLAACVGAPSTAEATPAATSAPVTVITLNVHGGTDREGGGNRGKTTAVSADVVALVVRHQPTVIALQELCGTQYRALRAKLAKLGYSGAFTNTQKASGCNDKRNGNQSGNGIFIKGIIETRYSWALPWGANPKGVTGRQPRRLLCVKPLGETWRACVTHLSPHAPDVLNQAARVAEAIDRWAGRVIVAGDFNLSSKWVGRSFPGYASAGADIDHVVTTGAVEVTAVDPVRSSDHPAVVGVAS